MPYRRRSRSRRRRRSYVPFAIPPSERKIKFVVKSDWVQLNPATGTNYIRLNDPGDPFGWSAFGTTQPPGFDFWMGTALAAGPYTDGVVYYCKTKASVICNNTTTATGCLAFTDNTLTPKTPAGSPNDFGANNTGVVMKHVVQSNDVNKTLYFTRKHNLMNVLDMQSTADLFLAGAAAVFGRATRPTFVPRDWYVPYDVTTNAFGTSPTGVWMSCEVTYYCVIRLRNAAAFIDV